jgi:hypothetical protein
MCTNILAFHLSFLVAVEEEKKSVSGASNLRTLASRGEFIKLRSCLVFCCVGGKKRFGDKAEVSNRLGIKLVTTLTSSSIRSTSLITNATQNPIKSNVFSAQQNLQAREKNCSEEIVADFSVFVAPSSAIISQHQAKNPRRSFPLFNPKKHRAKSFNSYGDGGMFDFKSKFNLIN